MINKYIKYEDKSFLFQKQAGITNTTNVCNCTSIGSLYTLLGRNMRSELTGFWDAFHAEVLYTKI